MTDTTNVNRGEVTDTDLAKPLSWDAPGPGSWELDTTHFSADCSRIARDVMEAGAGRGFEEGMANVGSPVRRLEMRFVNGRMYVTLVPLVGGRFNLPEPPTAVLKAVTRLHPEFRRRNARATEAIRERVWMKDFERWEREWKPELIAQNRRFGAFDLHGASHDELAAHIESLNLHVIDGMALHMRLHISDLGPIGLLLVEGADLGLDQAELMATLTGSSPATTEPAVSLNELRALVAAHPGDRPTSFDEIRAVSPEASALLDDHLAVFGDRLTTGYDLRAKTLREMPHILVRSIVEVDAIAPPVMQAVGDDMADSAVARVPESERPRLRQLIADARVLYGLRDENGPLTYQWPTGLLRRALLEAADRLIARGALDDLEGIFDLSVVEVSALLQGAANPTSAEIASRTRERQGQVGHEAPRTLGPVASEPQIDALPDGLAYLMRVILVVMRLIESQSDDTPTNDAGAAETSPVSTESTVLSGLGIGGDTYTGRARIASNADEGLDKMMPGDVLIAPYTVPTFNAVLAIAGAVVVEQGGLLCHAAVIAREFGIPGVVGATDAMATIPDGAMVEVNAAAGTVQVVPG